MSYWNKHPEKLEEITIDFLPEPWKTRVKSEEIELDTVPEDIRFKAMTEGTEDYQANLVDQAMFRVKAEKEDALCRM